MDVKAEVVLLIFTFNCVSLVLLSQDLIRSRLCRDRFVHVVACSSTRFTIPSSTNNATPIPPTLPRTPQPPPPPPPTIPPLIPQPTLPPQQQFSLAPSLQQLLQLPPSPPPPPLSEGGYGSLAPSSPPPLTPPNTVAERLTSGRYRDSSDDELAKEVQSCSLVIITTFITTSVASSQVLGRWIDRWSRRTLMLLPLEGAVLWAVSGVLVSTAPSLPLYLWLAGAALSGFSGGFVTLKAAATTYSVQVAAQQEDSTVRLALLQAATFLGILAAYFGLYFLAACPQVSLSDIFLGVAVLATLNVLFAILFLSDKSSTTNNTTTTTTNTTNTTTEARLDSQIITYNSNLDSHAQGGEGVEERRTGMCEKEGTNETGDEGDNERDENEEKVEEDKNTQGLNIKKTDMGDTTNPSMHPVFPINILVIPPEEDEHERPNHRTENEERGKQETKLGEINPLHLSACNRKIEGPYEGDTEFARTSNCSSSCCPRHAIPIIISSEESRSVYGTPPEHFKMPGSRYSTSPTQAPSRGSDLDTAVADSHNLIMPSRPQPPACPGVPCYNHYGIHEVLSQYGRPRHQIIRLSSSEPPSFPSLIHEWSNETPRILDETQTVNNLRDDDSQDDLLMTPNVVTTPTSSFISALGCDVSSSNSSREGNCDVIRGNDEDAFGDNASLDGIQTSSTVSSFDDTSALRQPESLLTVQSEGMGGVHEGIQEGFLTPTSESRSEGMSCAGGAARYGVCADGGLFCRLVSVTFRRREAGLRGIVVADVVAAFFVNVVVAALWEVTPLYLAAKMKWSLANWVSYLACRSGLRIVALVVLLPLLRLRMLLQDTTLGMLGGLSCLISCVFLSSLSYFPSAFPIALTFGLLMEYLIVASTAVLVRLVDVSELGAVLMCLGSIEHVGQMAGWLAFHYLFPLLLRHGMPGVSFLFTGLLLLIPTTIFGVLYFSLGLRQDSLISRGSQPRSSAQTTQTVDI